MALKVMVKQLKVLLLSTRSLVLIFVVPFLFRVLVPGFDGRAFPALLMVYVLLGIRGTGVEGDSIRAGATQFPVTVKDHIAGQFMFQAVLVFITAFMAAVYIVLSGPERFMTGIVIKTIGIALLLSGVITALSLWLPQNMARVISMLVFILSINFLIFQEAQGPVFLPWLSTLASLLMGGGGFCLLLALALRFPPQI